MAGDWNDLTRMTGGSRFVVERVRMVETGIAIEGSFELPPLARLPAEDQVFLVAFLRSRGNMREMERIFGISYPTVKNRLHGIVGRLGSEDGGRDAGRDDPLSRLERGEISFEEALEEISGN
ncbi:MAG: DUF2089 domain-containing protein [Dehalococcoidia bacterium]|nr:DUF2089 domain-containing protein [Dehalococcoidia bacterium]